MVRSWHAALTLLLLTAGCAAEEKPTPWEIIQGTATLTASIAVDSATGNPLVTYTGRTGRLTIGADSSVTGWLKLPAQDTMHVTGSVTDDGGNLVLVWTGTTPTTYKILTDPDFGSTYALISLDVLHANIAGDAAVESYLVYWEFER